MDEPKIFISTLLVLAAGALSLFVAFSPFINIFLIEAIDKSRQSFVSLSIDKIIGFNIIEIYPIISCLFEYEDKNTPKNELLSKNSSRHTPPMGIISSSSNL